MTTAEQRAERFARLIESAPPESAPDGELPPGVAPLGATTAASTTTNYIDVVFDDEGCYVGIESPDGAELHVGRWLRQDVGRRLRLPFPALTPVEQLGHAATHAHARRTEVKAAWSMEPKLGTTRQRVLACFLADYRTGGTGLLHEEVAQRTGLKHYTAAPRCTELVQGGWLEDSTTVRANAAGNDAIVWRLTRRAILHFEGSPTDASPDR